MILAEKIVLAEKREEHGFDDLLKVEELVAELVGVILLFVESPGSFAELGAFTANNLILKRLVVVVENQHRENTASFIYLGPLKRLLRGDPRVLLYYSWLNQEGGDPAVDASSAGRMAEDLATQIAEFQRRNGITAAMSDLPSDGDKMCLITGILDIFSLLGIEELEEMLRFFCRIESHQDLHRYLFVLCGLGFVGKFRYSNKWYYYSKEHFTDWRFVHGCRFRNRLDWKAHFIREQKKWSRDSASIKRLSALAKLRQAESEGAPL